MEFNAIATDEFQKTLEDNGFIVERVKAPLLYREDLGTGLVKSYAAPEGCDPYLLFTDVRDQIFLLGVYEKPGHVAIRFVLASEFKK
jgi:hypothetical protein